MKRILTIPSSACVLIYRGGWRQLLLLALFVASMAAGSQITGIAVLRVPLESVLLLGPVMLMMTDTALRMNGIDPVLSVSRCFRFLLAYLFFVVLPMLLFALHYLGRLLADSIEKWGGPDMDPFILTFIRLLLVFLPILLSGASLILLPLFRGSRMIACLARPDEEHRTKRDPAGKVLNWAFIQFVIWTFISLLVFRTLEDAVLAGGLGPVDGDTFVQVIVGLHLVFVASLVSILLVRIYGSTLAQKGNEHAT